MNLHVYAVEAQPATRFFDSWSSREFTLAARACRWCAKCRKRRWASRLTVQISYDDVRFLCAAGYGCTVRKVRKKLRRRRTEIRG
jgi:hypothetical protein